MVRKSEKSVTAPPPQHPKFSPLHDFCQLAVDLLLNPDIVAGDLGVDAVEALPGTPHAPAHHTRQKDLTGLQWVYTSAKNDIDALQTKNIIVEPLNDMVYTL